MRIVETQEKGKIRTTPSFALAMLIVNFVRVVRGFLGPITPMFGLFFRCSGRDLSPNRYRSLFRPELYVLAGRLLPKNREGKKHILSAPKLLLN